MRNKIEKGIIASLLMVLLVSTLASPVSAASWGKPDIQVSIGAAVGGSPENATRNVTVNWTVYSSKTTGLFSAQLKNGGNVIETISSISLSPWRKSVSGRKTVSLAPGEYDFTITADPFNAVLESNERNNNATVHVSVPKTPVLKTIKVVPSSVVIEVGATQVFTADARDQYGDNIPTPISWTASTVSVPNYDIGWIDSSGLFTADSPGKAIITAASGTVKGFAAVEVIMPLKVVNLAIGNVAVCCYPAPYPGQSPLPFHTPAYASTKDPIGVLFSVTNTGEELAPTGTMDVSVDGKAVMTLTRGPMIPGETRITQEGSNSLYGDFVTPGPHTLNVWITPLAGEQNTNDNYGSVPVYVYNPENSNLVLSDCGIHNAGAITGGPGTIGFKCMIRNNGTIPIYDFPFIAVTSEGNNLIYNNLFSLDPGQEQVVNYATAQAFPAEGKMLGVTFYASHSRCTEQELTCGDNYQGFIVYPLSADGSVKAVPIPGIV